MHTRFGEGPTEKVRASGTSPAAYSTHRGGKRSNAPTYPNYPLQKWLNVIFVDPDGIVSTMLFKTESMDNFLELHRQAIAAGGLLLGKAISARMSRRASRDSGQGYYAVEFEISGDGTYGSAIARFRQETAVEGIYRTLLSRPEPHVDAEAA